MKRMVWSVALMIGLLVGVVAPTTAAFASSSPRGSAFSPLRIQRPGQPDRQSGAGPRTVVSVESGGPYGSVLVVGGAGAGYVPASAGSPATDLFPAGSSLYFASIDSLANGWGPPGSYRAGCTTTVVSTDQGPLSCTGSETDPEADWPALTTAGPPVAGPGVSPYLLGEVYRTDLGTFQVTYAGHPLYLFDPGPASYSGSEFLETVAPLPPWHTAWYLIAPNGLPAAGSADLATELPAAGTTYSTPALGTVMLPAFGGVTVTVYAFSADGPWHSSCFGACAQDFVPVYTSAPPTAGTGVSPGAVGVILRPDGTHQVTYHGHPLYIDSEEQPLLGPGGPETTGTVGNGAGVHAFGGVFSVVNP